MVGLGFRVEGTIEYPGYVIPPLEGSAHSMHHIKASGYLKNQLQALGVLCAAILAVCSRILASPTAVGWPVELSSNNKGSTGYGSLQCQASRDASVLPSCSAKPSRCSRLQLQQLVLQCYSPGALTSLLQREHCHIHIDSLNQSRDASVLGSRSAGP